MIPILTKGKNKQKGKQDHRLQQFLDTENIITQEQAGFRKFHSTQNQATYLSQVIEDTFQAEKVVVASFIDLQKAFDKVWKDGLLAKLQKNGICGNMDQVLSS